MAIGFAAAAGYDSTLVLGTAIVGFAVLLTALQHAVGVGLVADLRQGWVTATDMLRQGATALAVAALAFAGGGLVGFWGAQVAGAVVALAALVIVVRRTMPLSPSFDSRRWRALLRDTLAYGLASAIAVLYFRLAMVLVSLICSEQQTGYFAAAFRGVEVLIVIPGIVVGAVFPILARAGRDDHVRLSHALGRVLDVSLVAACGVLLILTIGAPLALRIVGGTDFEPAADVLRLQAVGLAMSFLGAGPAYALLGLRRHRDIVVANTIALASCAVLVPLLASAHGAVGAAGAMAISESLLLACFARAVVRTGIPLRPDVRRGTRVLLATAVAAAPAALPVSVLVQTVLCGGLLVAALVALRALPPELRALLPSAHR